MESLAEKTTPENALRNIEVFTYFLDHLRHLETGSKAKSSLIGIANAVLYKLFERLPEIDSRFVFQKYKHSEELKPAEKEQILLVNADGFEPEGTDRRTSLASFLSYSFDQGYRNFILYNLSGQRLISTATMKGNCEGVKIDVYGIPGEYLGAFMQGGTLRVHGNSQNFTGMCMHHGTLQVFGNAGKVCGYASKGGKVFILGDINDRAWTNSVDDGRCEKLQVHILGSASKYAGESLMGGDFFFGGLYFDEKGNLKTQASPYRGTKLLGGASRGRMLFFDPYRRLDVNQYTQGAVQEIVDWSYWKTMVVDTLKTAGVMLEGEDEKLSFVVDEKSFDIKPENFQLIIPKGGLKGYECH